MRRSVVTGRTIYDDPRLHATTGSITLRGYWLPLGTPRTIPVSRLAGVASLARNGARWPRWGRSGGAWFPLDWSRPRRDAAVELWLVGGRRVVVTPSNHGRFVALLGGLGVAARPPQAT